MFTIHINSYNPYHLQLNQLFMETLLFTILVAFTSYFGFINSNYLFFIERGCTGSAYCSACTNCSGCKHCAKQGGSCGVCSSGSKKKTRSKSSTRSTHSIPKIHSYSFKSTVYTTTLLNLRSGPGTHYKIIEKLPKNEPLKYLETKDSWVKVKNIESGSIGYVYYKYLK